MSTGTSLPAVELASTDGSMVVLADLPGRTVVYAYRNPGAPSPSRWISEEFEQAELPGTAGLMSLY